MLYDVSIKITYDYPHRAEAGRHLLRLLPADLPNRQRVIAASLAVDPTPAERIDRSDFFGNSCVEVAYRNAVETTEFTMQARVNRFQSDPVFDVSPDLESLARELTTLRSLDPHSPLNHVARSVLVAPNEAITAWARTATRDQRTVFGRAETLCRALYKEMTFKPGATEVDTPIEEAFRLRRGVCQDFSHIAIAGLRGMGIPAGYVSGVIQTIPPEGEERLVGTDAMHAWIRAWCGMDMGWVEFDPTNNMLAGEDHVVIAYGRDYFDVSPVRGALRSSGPHTTEQAVDVIEVPSTRG